VDHLKYIFPNTDYLECPHYYYILKLSSEFDTMLCFRQEFWLAPSKSFKERATTKEFSFQFNPSSPFSLPFPLPLVSSSESGGTSSGGGSSSQTSGPASGHSGSEGSGTRLGSSVGGQTSFPSASRGHGAGWISRWTFTIYVCYQF
jgi:hypothetical protein